MKYSNHKSLNCQNISILVKFVLTYKLRMLYKKMKKKKKKFIPRGVLSYHSPLTVN